MKNLKSLLSKYLDEHEHIDDDVWDNKIGEEIKVSKKIQSSKKPRATARSASESKPDSE